ncbi:putative bifunctional diguanylate cyclase/phosphodiesterase [Lysobacter humi (ex Lee et al. 2017)]
MAADATAQLGHGARNSWGWTLAAVLGAVLLAYAVIPLSWIEDTRVAGIRLAGAWTLGMLLLRRPSHALAIGVLLATFIVFAAGAAPSARTGETMDATLRSALRVLEAGLAYAAFVVARRDPRGLASVSDLAWVVGIAVAGAPALTASAAWLIEGGRGGWTLWRDWFVGGAFGMLTLLPAMLAATPQARARLLRRRELVRFGIVALLCVVTTVVAVRAFEGAFVVIVIPLVLAALRLGSLGSALIHLLVVATLLALHRAMPDDLAPGLAGLEFRDVAAYAALAMLAPLVVAVQTEARRAASRALRDALERFRLVTDNMPAAIGRIDASGRYELVNRRYAQFLGQPASGVIGRTPRDVLGDHYADSVAAHVACARAGEPCTFETRVGDRDLEVHYIPHAGRGGVDGIFVLALDLTARKAAERALSAEKERFRVTLDSIGDAVVACDTDMRITLLNPVAEDLTGWAESDALGRHVGDVVRLVDPATGQPPLSPLQIALGEDRIVALQREMLLERRDGERRPIEDTAAPIRDREGRLVGGVMVFHDISQTRAMALKMSHQAQHDPLTDLPNRVLLQDRLEHALAGVPLGLAGALLFVDLDHFKTINDSLGHQTGDLVLQEVARRLLGVVGAEDTVSRQGGDEFVVLLERRAEPQDAARVAEAMLLALREPVEVEEHRLHVSASIGIALYPQDAQDMRSLMRQADAALYHAKHAGRGRFSYFTRSMGERAERRLRLEHDLRDALAAGDLFLVYQPKVHRPDGIITGMEALVRWRRADGTLVPPLDFIPVAEESGLVGEIDRWVMLTACRQSKRWLDAGLLHGPVSVNVSLARFDADRLLAMVSNALRGSGLPGPLLEVEFTESQMFADPERAGRLIAGLRSLEVRIAIDDFGTGYSNLGYLTDHRFDTIKIDRSFVRRLPDDRKQGAVVQAIVAMAHALEAQVVAEGVETAAQAATLDGHGCDQVQGYYYSRPVPAEAFEALLARGARVEPAPVE